MQAVLLPLFPLHVVLLPGAELPLHIFEDRYKEMIGEVMRDHLEFGIVLATEKGIVNIGCSATVDEVLRQYPDGRLDILTRGRRRFEIVRLNEERAFLRGAVDFFDDDQSAPASEEIRKRAIDGYHQLRALPGADSEESPGATDQQEEPLAANQPQLSFRLAQSVPDLSFRQVLLATRSEAERLRQLADFLPSYLNRRRRIQHVKQVAPTNGHGKGSGIE